MNPYLQIALTIFLTIFFIGILLYSAYRYVRGSFLFEDYDDDETVWFR